MPIIPEGVQTVGTIELKVGRCKLIKVFAQECIDTGETGIVQCNLLQSRTCVCRLNCKNGNYRNNTVKIKIFPSSASATLESLLVHSRIRLSRVHLRASCALDMECITLEVSRAIEVNPFI